MATLDFIKEFKKNIINFIEDDILVSGYKRSEFSIKNGIFEYEKTINNYKIRIYFEIPKIIELCSEFYIRIYSPGKGLCSLFPDAPFIRNDSGNESKWIVNEANDIKQLLIKAKEIILEYAIPWAESELFNKIDHQEILIIESEEFMKKNNFLYSNENSGKKDIFMINIKNSPIYEVLLLTFLRKTEIGYDVIRFEIHENKLSMFCRLLFYPESKSTKQIDTTDLNTPFSITFSNEEKFRHLVKTNIEVLYEFGIKWFENNRPKTKSKMINMGIFPI